MADVLVAKRIAEGNDKAFDEFTLEECQSMHEATGMIFICGDGVIQEIWD